MCKKVEKYKPTNIKDKILRGKYEQGNKDYFTPFPNKFNPLGSSCSFRVALNKVI